MRITSPDSGENRIFSVLSVYPTFDPGKHLAELRERQDNRDFSSDGRAVFVLQWLAERSWPHSMFFTAHSRRRRR